MATNEINKKSRGPMSDAHKAKLAQGKADAAAKRQKVEDRAAKAWLVWCKEDAGMYQIYRQAINMYDAGSKEVQRAYAAWQKVKRTQPPIPNNASVKRVRGLKDID